MKRDIDLFKKILQRVRDEMPYDAKYYEFMEGDFDCTHAMVKYHIRLLASDDFVEAIQSFNGVKIITNKGHDLLELLENTGIMAKIKDHASKFPDLTLSAIFSVAVQFGVEQLTALFHKLTG